MKKVKSTNQKAETTLQIYLKEIGKAPLLTAEQERVLARRVKKGDEKARQQFIEANLRLVVHVAKRYTSAADPERLMDLIQEGNLGLFRAVDRYNPKFKTRFSTYAMYWIRQAIGRSLSEQRTIRLPENVLGEINKMRRARHQLYQQLHRQPSTGELARELNTSLKRLHQLEEVSQSIVSLDQPIQNDENDEERRLGELLTDLDTPQPEFIASQHMLRGQVRKVVSRLPAREQRIVRMRFGLDNGIPMTLEEIGQQFGISRERVRQIQEEAFQRIREGEATKARLR